MEKLVAMKNSKKKGFTLVELIVVLVILAILAAILIPTLTQYIDKANNRAIVAETRAAVMAAQTLASEDYANKTETCTAGNVKALAELSGTVGEKIDVTNGRVVSLTYSDGGKTCTYTWSADAGGVYK